MRRRGGLRLLSPRGEFTYLGHDLGASWLKSLASFSKEKNPVGLSGFGHAALTFLCPELPRLMIGVCVSSGYGRFRAFFTGSRDFERLVCFF